MSSYETTAVHRKTGKEHKIFCFDDYYGHHQYGYDDGVKIMTEKEFSENYEVKS